MQALQEHSKHCQSTAPTISIKYQVQFDACSMLNETAILHVGRGTNTRYRQNSLKQKDTGFVHMQGHLELLQQLYDPTILVVVPYDNA